MNYLELKTKNCNDTTLNNDDFNKTISHAPHTKFLCLANDDNLTWDNHIDQLISRLNSACHAITAVKAMLSRKALRVLHFPYVHPVTSYSIIFGLKTLIVLKYSECKINIKNYD
jgi:hypothetical protein